MRPERTKTWIAGFGSCLAAAAVLAVLTGCDGRSSSDDEVNATYLRVAQSAREYTRGIDRATERLPRRPRALARRFRSFAKRVDYFATFVLTAAEVGPVASRGFVFQHSLVIYESALRAVAKRARAGHRPPDRNLREVRQVGVEVRRSGAAWERALRAAIAG